jgi:chromosome partitioning protein
VNWRKELLPRIREIEATAKYRSGSLKRMTPNRHNVNKIVVLNPKGGCGKSTLVTSLAARYAQYGTTPTIMDYDPQGSSIAWLSRRSDAYFKIHGIEACKQSMHATRSWQLRLPSDTVNLLIDSPASISHDDLHSLTSDATNLLVPVMPSAMDIHAAAGFIKDLLLVAKIDRRERKLAVVANRTRKNTKSFSKLMRFLDSLGIPIIAVLRDSQNFVHAAEQGIGVSEMPPSRVREEVEQLDTIVRWLDAWPERRAQLAATLAASESSSAPQPTLRIPSLSSA